MIQHGAPLLEHTLLYSIFTSVGPKSKIIIRIPSDAVEALGALAKDSGIASFPNVPQDSNDYCGPNLVRRSTLPNVKNVIGAAFM